MSYDISLDALACPHCGRGGSEIWTRNSTCNVSRIVDHCLADAGAMEGKDPSRPSTDLSYSWRRLHGWYAGAVIEILDNAHRIAMDPSREHEFRKMEPSNGWGSLETVREDFAALLAACKENPGAMIRVSW